MSQEAINLLLGALLGFFLSLLTQVVGYIFQRKNDERKRKWELEDREFNRKVNVKDERLQEAQAYLEAYKEALLQLLALETRLIQFDTRTAQADFDDYSERFENIRNLTNFSFKRLFSINFLNDPELQELNNKLVAAFNKEMENALELRLSLHNHKDIDKEAVEHRKKQFNAETAKFLGDMQRRLEKVSQQVP